MTRMFSSEAEFWPFYLREHGKHATRLMHVTGTSCGLGFALIALVTRNAWWLAAALIAGYGLAWAAHFGVEKNRPATFAAPWWSFRADIRMWWYWVTRRLEGELRRYDIKG